MIRARLHHLLETQAHLTPDARAVSSHSVTWTYRRTWAEAAAAAGLLLRIGLRRGDRVAIYLEKRLETVAAIFATSAADGVFVPVNHVLKPAQVEHILTDSGARVLVTSAARLAQLAQVLAGTTIETVVIVGEQPAHAAGDIGVHAWTDAGSSAPDLPTTSIDIDPAAILYTSGSTGRPKGVVLSHRNLLVGAASVSAYLGNSADDVILSILPLSFDAGLSQVTTAFAVGAHCVLMNYLLPQDVPKLCAEYGVTGVTCVPPLWIQLVDVAWPQPVARRIRYWANTGGRMPQTTLNRLRATFSDADPYLMYGLTEAFRSTYLEPSEVDRRPDSIGKAIPAAEILVLRPDGSSCEPGEPGELVHRGALVALGYWNDTERTAERFRLFAHPDQDWRAPERAVWSGDTVVADDDGYLYFVGRVDDMIKTSGYRVSPTELEEAAYSTGLVRDVVAIGVADEALGQRIVLVVTPAGDALAGDGLTGALRSRVPAYMMPSRVVVQDDLPRSPNGKFDRAFIKAEVSR
ncbi:MULTISPECIES: acyl-CoA ligase (AMP-forming), exosortase A system-associated [unclassified Microbacterium]|uniref:acyl-CoA ligase (AMP-forming), exosortase A system-associated n=1 Tax=unclassified Microbacterium TaxID=2609290 RepID=UPI00214AEF35|nr:MULTISPECIES: acyl-CoA ligase (AMP-forming), exosortase A system-associated [unclassified Microbacterium]MCR2784998.1 acyl-CoA ligase (AMP-forming), exosortase A system-associated [Microbacterium sp. zg.B96]WIM16537.1 acyl-CoA ligase (AMP-forming), exosortase A system-associated [Microbacterium sp. zg-B96]